MSTEHQLRVHVFSIFFIVALIYQEIEGMNDSEFAVFMLLKNCFIHVLYKHASKILI